tara:strand:- start:512 stop:1231 length:720 start_codon:yes stop_codon:yes gene_type:complete
MSINLGNNVSFESQQRAVANTLAKNQLAQQYHSAVQNQGLANKINIAKDIAGLGEKGREFSERVSSYAEKVSRGIQSDLGDFEMRDVNLPEEEPQGQEARSIVSKALGVSEDTASRLGKWGTRAGIIGTAGIDIAEDIADDGVVGENWLQKTENIGNIAGGVMETAGLVMPEIAPELELGGVIVSGIGDLVGDIGDLIDNHAKTSDLKKQETQAQASIPSTQGTPTLASEGQILTQKAQ